MKSRQRIDGEAERQGSLLDRPVLKNDSEKMSVPSMIEMLDFGFFKNSRDRLDKSLIRCTVHGIPVEGYYQS